MLPRNKQRLFKSLVGTGRAIGYTQPTNAKLGYGDGSGRIVKSQNEMLAYIFYGELGSVTDSPGEAYFPSGDCGVPFMDDVTNEGLDVVLRYPPGGGRPEIFRIHPKGISAVGGRPPSAQRMERALHPTLKQIDVLRPIGVGTTAKLPGRFFFRNPLTGLGDFIEDPTLPLGGDIAALTSGQHQLAYLYFDPATGTAERVLSSASSASGTLPKRSDFTPAAHILPLMNSVPSHVIDIGVVYLYYGQTELVDADWYREYESRQLFEPILRHKFNASSAPTANDDQGDGYGVGSEWLDVSNNHSYICLNPALGAAVWKQTDNSTSTLGVFAVYSGVSDVSNGAGSETDLISHTIAAGSLATNGDHVILKAAGSFAATVNTKRLRVKWGAATIYDSGALPISSATSWEIEVTIVRTGATSQRCSARLITSDAALVAVSNYATASETLSGAIALKVTGEAVGAADITESFSLATVIRSA